MANISANIKNLKERESFYFKLKLAALIVFTWFVVELLDSMFKLGLENFGLKPKSVEGLIGILTFPFLHGDWNHLLSNGSSALILFTGLFVFHAKRGLLYLLILYLGSGILLWFIGQSGTNHIGASGLIYAVAFFLFVASVREGNRNSMALTFFIILMYGSMIWGLTPFTVKANVSWEGHLSGAIIGVILALYVYKDYVKPQELFVEDERPFFERHPLDI
ncbi:MAG: membrane associated rhomboid family serine protease [Chitinophagales bacterium]|jgi:membrane associated rhomboid family serine protease